MNETPRERLRKAIATIGSTPAAVAKRLEMSRQNLHAILDGRPVRDHFAARFEALFGISQNWLLTGEGEMRVHLPQDRDAELPELDQFPVKPIGTSAVLGSTFKVPRAYLCDTSPNVFRYVLRIDDRDLSPFVLKDDRLLMDGRFDLEIQRHGQFIDDRLCAVVLDDKRLLRWVRVEMIRGKIQVQLLTGPKRIEVTLKAAQTNRLQVVGMCAGLIWRSFEALSNLDQDLDE